jgi:hypothetical protein
MVEVKEHKSASSWEDVVKLKRAAQLTAVKPYLELEIPPTDPITDIDDVEKLAQLLRDRNLSAEEVILAYIKRWMTPTCRSVRD